MELSSICNLYAKLTTTKPNTNHPVIKYPFRYRICCLKFQGMLDANNLLLSKDAINKSFSKVCFRYHDTDFRHWIRWWNANKFYGYCNIYDMEVISRDISKRCAVFNSTCVWYSPFYYPFLLLSLLYTSVAGILL